MAILLKCLKKVFQVKLKIKIVKIHFKNNEKGPAGSNIETEYKNVTIF